jgi:large subunit ribosomal protein L18
MKSTMNLKFKRRRIGVTNYKKRFALVKSGLYRVVVRKSNTKIIGQVVFYSEKGDVVKADVNSNMLKKYGWNSRPNKATAYLTGMLLAKNAKEKIKDSECILDIGLSPSISTSIPFVFAKGCADNGLNLKNSIELDEKVYNYASTAKYAEAAKGKQFSTYKNVSSMPELFNKIRDELKKDK